MGQSTTFDVDVIVGVLTDSVAVLESAGIPYAAIGTVAASAWGDVVWPRERADIDFLIRSSDVERALDAFREAGFTTAVPDGEDWLVKAHRKDVLVDLIFWAARRLRYDPEMIERTAMATVAGCLVRIIPPEDYIVMQALTFSKDTPHHLFNGASVVRHATLDWDYVLRRAEGAEPHVVSLIAHAITTGARVPADVMQTLCERIGTSPPAVKARRL